MHFHTNCLGLPGSTSDCLTALHKMPYVNQIGGHPSTPSNQKRPRSIISPATGLDLRSINTKTMNIQKITSITKNLETILDKFNTSNKITDN